VFFLAVSLFLLNNLKYNQIHKKKDSATSVAFPKFNLFPPLPLKLLVFLLPRVFFLAVSLFLLNNLKYNQIHKKKDSATSVPFPKFNLFFLPRVFFLAVSLFLLNNFKSNQIHKKKDSATSVAFPKFNLFFLTRMFFLAASLFLLNNLKYNQIHKKKDSATSVPFSRKKIFPLPLKLLVSCWLNCSINDSIIIFFG